MVSMIRHWDVLGNDGAVAQPTWLRVLRRMWMIRLVGVVFNRDTSQKVAVKKRSHGCQVPSGAR